MSTDHGMILEKQLQLPPSSEVDKYLHNDFSMQALF